MVAYDVISAHGRLRQEDCCELSSNLVYTVTFRAAWAIVACHTKQNQREQKVGHGNFYLLCFLGEMPKPSLAQLSQYTRKAVCLFSPRTVPAHGHYL